VAQIAAIAAAEKAMDEEDARNERVLCKSALELSDRNMLRNAVMGALVDMPCFERLVESHRRDQEFEAHISASVERGLQTAARRLVEDVRDAVMEDVMASADAKKNIC
jgi:hypothetical protein